MGQTEDPLTLFEIEEQEVRKLLLSAAEELDSPLADLVSARIGQLFPPIRAAIVLCVGYQPPDSPLSRQKRLSLAAGLEMLYVALDIHRLLLATAASRSSQIELDQAGRSFIGSTILAGNFCSAGFPPLPTDRLELIGEKASIIFDNNTLRLIGNERLTISFDLQEAYQKSYDNAIAHFIGALESGKPFETDRLDNLETLRLVSDAYRFAGL